MPIAAPMPAPIAAVGTAAMPDELAVRAVVAPACEAVPADMEFPPELVAATTEVLVRGPGAVLVTFVPSVTVTAAGVEAPVPMPEPVA